MVSRKPHAAPRSRSHAAAIDPTPAPPKNDALDRELIRLLQANARESSANLARKLGVARTTVVACLSRLEASGVIVGYTTRLGSEAADRGVQAFVGITVQPQIGRAHV